MPPLLRMDWRARRLRLPFDLRQAGGADRSSPRPSRRLLPSTHDRLVIKVPHLAGSGLLDAADTLPVALCHRIVGWSISGAWRMMTRDA